MLPTCSAVRYSVTSSHLHDLSVTKEINKVHYKESTPNYFPNANKQNDGRNVILVFEQGMQQMSKTFVECSKHQQDALIMLKLQKLYAIKSSM